MIVRRLDARTVIVLQTEHARQSGVLGAALRPEFLGAPADQVDLVRAIALHDIGWTQWERGPHFAPDGLPVNFTDLPQSTHDAIWDDGIFNLLHHVGPAAAAYLGRHGDHLEAIHGGSEKRRDLITALAQRAWPEASAEKAFARTEQGFRALFFCDALSLVACAGWESAEVHLLNTAGENIPISARRTGDWTIEVDPWPFCAEEMRGVFVDACVVERGQEKSSAQILRSSRESQVRIPIDYVPMKEASR
ncbi:hypothetical protein BH09SUM1_BH09SUM1_12980 [soil metagenome]